MAASSILVNNALGVSYQIGVDSKGNDIFKGQSFKNISTTATDEDLVVLCDAVDEVIAYNISTIKKVQTYVVTRG
ncbi:DUF1659 domain-containing protein [Clostridium sp. Sa3CUN1]|uniref:DUF1659 domain-containing protein n=1 Tax=Clostridium gallinarum TaxID=2762246 RepID=A0ABR8Q6L0_9CLOT|nr:DUF1659 domain-containing protein [Clostridium gallinarum]MBD7916071.1 DUF1659 domain-containing protein [Clostridium gallinarum]